MIQLLAEISKAVAAAKTLGQQALSAEQHTGFQKQYDQIVAEGLAADPPRSERKNRSENEDESNKLPLRTCWIA